MRFFPLSGKNRMRCRLVRSFAVLGQSEAHLQGHLEMGDLAVLDVTTGLDDLEPLEVADRLVRPGDGALDGVVDAGLR